MSLINWAGTEPFDRLERRLNQVFDHLNDPWMTTRRARHSPGDTDPTSDLINPNVDVIEDEKCWRVCAEMPGVRKEDIKVDASDSSLVLSAESKCEKDYNRDNVRYQERRYGTFMRSIPLPESVDRDNISASYQDGVLNITLPKGEAAKPKKITIA
ncbi:hypothetical protein BGZ70_004733 [Mortierella alpina]|uniref:SHSP domain-containing protein n=1 Tax=Mortierella alpina TaxID=64518 RepID=A0A9P6IQE0_MORAP|nr:hypothetical protein BGZ70_004733 [Mortierella alpina]